MSERLLELSVAGQSRKEFDDIEFHIAKEQQEVAFTFRRAQRQEFFCRNVEGVVVDQGAFHHQVAMNGDGAEQVTSRNLFQVVLAERHTGVMLHLVVEERMKLEEFRHGEAEWG